MPQRKTRGKKPFHARKPIGKSAAGTVSAEQEEISRVKIPRDNQVIGILDQRLGGSRCNVRCFDGKTRLCRIPGRLKRRLWVRLGDVVLVDPWEYGGDEKGDIIFKYKPTQVQWLKTRGLFTEIADNDEF